MFRHKKGNGKKSVLAEVSPDSTIGATSSILGDSDVEHSEVQSSTITDSTVLNSIVAGSEITNTIVTQATLTRARVECDIIHNSAVSRSNVLGASKIFHSGLFGVRVANVTARDCQMRWDSEPIDFKNGYISRGVWYRPPRFLYLPISEVVIVESMDGRLHVNCTEMLTLEWLRRGKRYGKKFDLTPAELAEAIAFGESLLNDDPGPPIQELDSPPA